MSALLCPSFLNAQYSSSSSDSEAPEIPRVWLGIYGSYTPFAQVSNKDIAGSGSEEELTTKAANGRAGVGLNVNIRIKEGYALNLGGIYRFSGYDLIDTVNNTIGDVYTYRVRARYFDFPAMVRYSSPRFRFSKYAFYEAGGVLRHASERSASTAADSSNVFCCAPSPNVTFNSNVKGVIAGIGLTARDPVGIIVTPEVRYTRWFEHTFHAPAVISVQNQLEIGITLGF